MQTMKELDTQNLPGVEVKEVTPQTTEVVESLGNKETVVNQTEQVNKEVPKTVDDLISRVSRVRVEEPQKHVDNPFGLTSDDFQKVTTDPVLSKYYKSMHSDYIKKTTAVADEKKTVDAKLAEMSTWSKDRVKTLQSDPAFLKAAQEVLAEQNPPNSGYSDEAWSNLDPEIKKRLQVNEQRILELEQKSQLQNQLVELKQQDETLKTRYANYNPEAVDIITSDLLTGKVRATREDLWKVYDYEPAVKRAYELGRQDGNVEKVEKTNSISAEGLSTMQPNNEVPKANDKENTSSYFGRLVMNNLTKKNIRR